MPDKDDSQSEIQEHLDLLSNINDIINRLCGIRETNHIIEVLVTELVNRTAADEGVIKLMSPLSDDRFSSFMRLRNKEGEAMPNDLINPISGLAIRNRSLLKIDDISSDKRFPGFNLDSKVDKFKSFLCSPMIERGQILGTVILSRSAGKDNFTEKQSRLLGIFTPQAAHFIATAKLLEELAATNRHLEIAQKKLEEENRKLKSAIKSEYSFEKIVGKSDKMKKALILASKFCSTDSPVLIMGETGTGKELIATASSTQ